MFSLDALGALNQSFIYQKKPLQYLISITISKFYWSERWQTPPILGTDICELNFACHVIILNTWDLWFNGSELGGWGKNGKLMEQKTTAELSLLARIWETEGLKITKQSHRQSYLQHRIPTTSVKMIWSNNKKLESTLLAEHWGWLTIDVVSRDDKYNNGVSDRRHPNHHEYLQFNY